MMCVRWIVVLSMSGSVNWRNSTITANSTSAGQRKFERKSLTCSAPCWLIITVCRSNCALVDPERFTILRQRLGDLVAPTAQAAPKQEPSPEPTPPSDKERKYE